VTAILAIGLTAMLAQAVWLPMSTIAASGRGAVVATSGPMVLTVRLDKDHELTGLRLVETEANGRLDPGPLVGSSRHDQVAEALAGLPAAGATGLAINRGDDLTGTLLVPLGLTGGDLQTGLALDPTGTGAGSPGKATFMGVEAMGRRFLIIADRSGSMAGPKFDRLVAELTQTVKGLKPGARFYVILYNQEALPYPDMRWLSGRRDTTNFLQWLAGVGPAGNTNPLSAFQVAFSRLRPRPDAIFFMTDGLFSPLVADEIPALNVGHKPVPIHSISFVDRSSEAWLRKIADDSKGTYRHVDLSSP
jgi:hypothetical protein